jgi:hypothetical protein
MRRWATCLAYWIRCHTGRRGVIMRGSQIPITDPRKTAFSRNSCLTRRWASRSPTQTRNPAPFAGTSLLGILGALLAIAALGRAEAQPRKFEIGDVQKIVNVSSPSISPDGKSIVIVVTCVNWDEDRHDRQLVLVDIATGAQWQLTNIRKGLSSPQWSPTGDRLAFLAEAGEEKKAAEQILVLPISGGNRGRSPARLWESNLAPARCPRSLRLARRTAQRSRHRKAP